MKASRLLCLVLFLLLSLWNRPKCFLLLARQPKCWKNWLVCCLATKIHLSSAAGDRWFCGVRRARRKRSRRHRASVSVHRQPRATRVFASDSRSCAVTARCALPSGVRSASRRLWAMAARILERAIQSARHCACWFVVFSHWNFRTLHWLPNSTSFSTGRGSSDGQLPGFASLVEAIQFVNELAIDLTLGGVTLPERHRVKLNEHQTLCEKQSDKHAFFISQVVYNADLAIMLLRDYAAECKRQGLKPRRMVFCFAPCSRKRSESEWRVLFWNLGLFFHFFKSLSGLSVLRFLRWLGVEVPDGTAARILTAESSVDESVAVCVENFAKILRAARQSMERPTPTRCSFVFNCFPPFIRQFWSSHRLSLRKCFAIQEWCGRCRSNGLPAAPRIGTSLPIGGGQQLKVALVILPPFFFFKMDWKEKKPKNGKKKFKKCG